MMGRHHLEREMSDPKTTPAEPEHHVAKVGHRDAGELVTTAGGELIEGTIADITDGDDHHLRSHRAHKPPPGEHRVAQVGRKDSDEIVKTAGGELIHGRIADVTDGDD
jgi:hypothetical protein